MEIIVIIVLAVAFMAAEWAVYRFFGDRKLEYRIYVDKTEAFEGEEIAVVEELSNRKLLPIPWAKTEISTSEWLDFIGTSSCEKSGLRFVPSIFALKPYQKCIRRWRVRCVKRGVYELGNSTLVCSDLFGMTEFSLSLISKTTLTVLPKPASDEPPYIANSELFGEISVRRFICEDPFFVTGTREYTGREPMKSIHWSNTAKSNALMVFQHDFTTSGHVLIVLNMQKSCGGVRPARLPETEAMIKTAALAAEFCEENSLSFSLAVNDFEREPTIVPFGSGNEHKMQLLRTLAALEFVCERDFSAFFRELDVETFSDIVVITPDFSAENFAYSEHLRGMGKGVLLYSTEKFECGFGSQINAWSKEAAV